MGLDRWALRGVVAGVGAVDLREVGRVDYARQKTDQPQPPRRFRLPEIEPDRSPEQERAGEQGEEGLQEEGPASGDLGQVVVPPPWAKMENEITSATANTTAASTSAKPFSGVRKY